MSIFLLVCLVFILSALFSENPDVYDIPEEFQSFPEVAQMKILCDDRYGYLI